MFSQNVIVGTVKMSWSPAFYDIVGTVKMSWSPAFYDSQTWGNILKDRMGYTPMIETARNPRRPKVAAVITMVNRGKVPTTSVF